MSTQEFLSKSQLGKSSSAKKAYAPELLFAVPRALARNELPLSELSIVHEGLPFYGCDIWNAYEAAWLNANGQTQVAVLQIEIPCHSPCIVESKSLKLYLQSLRHSKFNTPQDYLDVITKDLSRLCQAAVSAHFVSHVNQTQLLVPPQGVCLDDLNIRIQPEEENPIRSDLLTTQNIFVDQTCFTHTFESNCPVTSQPDWATIVIHYSGALIHHENLLKYLLSYRHHLAFHEACVEKIFSDIMLRCHPKLLQVNAYFTRRGGIDINPYRSNILIPFHYQRMPRQ